MEIAEKIAVSLVNWREISLVAQITKWIAGLLVALIAVLTGLDWGVMTTSASLNLLFAQVQAPLGVVLFGAAAVFVMIFYIATSYNRLGHFIENRRLLKELELARGAVKATDTDRIDALNTALTAELKQIGERLSRLEALASAGLES